MKVGQPDNQPFIYRSVKQNHSKFGRAELFKLIISKQPWTFKYKYKCLIRTLCPQSGWNYWTNAHQKRNPMVSW